VRIAAILIVASIALPANWPSFRGPAASGVSDSQELPASWNVNTGDAILWKTPIPGLAHSSPIVWQDRIFLTTAISSLGDASFKRGLYGEGTASTDLSPHEFKLLSLDRKSGKILWERTAFQGPPREKRHIKSTYANATPATNGQVVVAFFGSQGIYAYDFAGKQLWKRDLGRLDAGAYDAPDYEWGTASSPILYGNLVIVQCDQQKGSFLIALDHKSGNVVWKTERDELPSWGTPAIYPGKTRTELVTNGSNFIRGYDPKTGKELWRLGGSSKITAPTPVYSGDLIFVASGRRPEAPIFAIRAGASGDITLPKGQSESQWIAWSKQQRGSYMPTPLIYGEYFYVLANQGIFDCYEMRTGRDVYRQRIPHSGSGFSASPVASGGRIYLPGEDGEVFVVKAGAAFEMLGKNEMGESIMATPAIAKDMLIVRTDRHLWGIGKGGQR
jgi:outer membrane protein assembly factor BamB